MTRRLAAVDAQTYWMSRAIPNDQFLVYGFDDGWSGLEAALREVGDRARACPELRVRIADGGFWSYPEWRACEVGDDRFVVHELADPAWQACLDAVTGLAGDQLDPRVMPWRVHVFPGADGPAGARCSVVAVLQISHALGDGRRSSAIAARLFGRPSAIPQPLTASRPGWGLPWRAFRAARAHRALARDTGAGLVPAQAVSRPALRTNAHPAGRRQSRTVIRERARMPGATVTVDVLTAVSDALAGHLGDLGEDTALLGAEVPMAKAGKRRANNHFGNVGVGLYPELAAGPRRAAIEGDLYQRRRRAAHPAMRAEGAAFASVPAPLLRWGVRHFDPALRSDTVIGNTVVSSVDRGQKDLHFGRAAVVFTAGLPGLSPMMGLTHGVHGIGDTVAISVHAAESAIGDIDAYVDRLEWALPR